MATSQSANAPRRRRIGDRAPAAPPDGDPTTTPPTEPTTPSHPPRARRTAGDRRAFIDAHSQQATDDSATSTVIVQPRDFRLPDVLKHIEAGEIVLIMPPQNDPD